jgi:hypothetical protein
MMGVTNRQCVANVHEVATKHRPQRKRQSLLAAACLCAAQLAAAATLAPGMPMPAIALADQHDVKASIGPDTRIVLFARDMDAADLAEEALAADGAALLTDAGALFVSDISGMPGMIRKLIALPAMRKRPYRMLLDREGDATADMPVQKGKVTVLRLDALEIEAVEYVGSAAQLRGVLESARRPDPQAPP